MGRTSGGPGGQQEIGGGGGFWQNDDDGMDTGGRATSTPGTGAGEAAPTFDFCLSTSIPVLTTSTYVVAWPQGDQFLGGDL